MLLPALADTVRGGRLHWLLVLLYRGEPCAELTWPGWLGSSCLSAPSQTRTPAPVPDRASPTCLHRVHRELLATKATLCGAGRPPPAASCFAQIPATMSRPMSCCTQLEHLKAHLPCICIQTLCCVVAPQMMIQRVETASPAASGEMSTGRGCSTLRPATSLRKAKAPAASCRQSIMIEDPSFQPG